VHDTSFLLLLMLLLLAATTACSDACQSAGRSSRMQHVRQPGMAKPRSLALLQQSCNPAANEVAAPYVSLLPAAFLALLPFPAGTLVQHGNLIDASINASSTSGLGRSAFNSPLEWQASTTTYTGPAAAAAAAAAAAVAASGPASSFGSGIIDPSLMSHQQHQQQMMGPNSSNNGSHDVSRLYKQYRTSQEYAAAEMHPANISTHATAAAAAAAVDPAAQLTADAVRVHQEQHLLRQQRQLLLKVQQAEAAAAAAKAARLQQLQVQHQQQQAALAAHAAAAAAASFGGSQASSQAAQPMPLYGQFRPAKAAQQHWEHSGVATTSSHPSTSSRHHAAAATGLPPRPSTNSSHHQQQHLQQQQSLFAGGSSSSSSASSRGTVVFPRGGSAAAPSPAAAAPAAAPAGSARPLGAWSGAYAVINTAGLPASQESDHTSGCFALECEEDLFSMATGDGYYYQPMTGASGLQHQMQEQQQMYGSRYAPVDLPQAEVDEQLASLIEESGSTRPDDDCPSCDMDEDAADQADAGPAGGSGDQSNRGLGFDRKSNSDSIVAAQPEDVDAAALVAAQAAALATQQAAEQRQGVVLQVLGRVASLRKGQAVLTANPRAAVAAGATSARSRLLITEVSLYTNRAANSQMALDQSNVLMGKMAIPGAALLLCCAAWRCHNTHTVLLNGNRYSWC
jgi:hypothetical protein